MRDKFGLAQLTLVGDRGMITSARIEALKDLSLGPTPTDASRTRLGWLAFAALARFGRLEVPL